MTNVAVVNCDSGKENIFLVSLPPGEMLDMHCTYYVVQQQTES